MNYFLSRRAVLKWLETPSVYQIAKDELYELDNESFRFLRKCSSSEGCASKDGAFIDYCLEEGILTAEKVALQRPPLARSPEPSLRYLELQITDACNLRCRHCYIAEPTRGELSPALVLAVLKEFEAMQGLRVMITGGEPLLHGQFGEINERLPEFFLRKVLFTNGLLLGRETVKSLKVDEIQVSIDGLEQAHDGLRGSGSFQRAMTALKLALDAGFDVSVSTMVHRGNLADFDRLERLFKSMGIKDWTVDIPCASGRLEQNMEFHVTPEEGGKYLGYGYGAGLHAASRGYGCGRHLASIAPDGAIAKCTFYSDRPAGDIAEGLLPSWKKVRPVLLKDLSCSCEYLEVCRGGCRYRAELLGGKGAKDLYRCMLYGIL
jgi:radical SAM protein with 4Fe4S-binding SPASM domain